LQAAVSDLGSRTVDRRTSVGRALAEWRRDLIADLGGPEQISKQREALVDLCVREMLMLDSIDAYLLELGRAIINRKRRSLLPVVRERRSSPTRSRGVSGRLAWSAAFGRPRLGGLPRRAVRRVERQWRFSPARGQTGTRVTS
jgi:hypothetical protein